MRLFVFSEAPITQPIALQAGVVRERWALEVSWRSVGVFREVFFRGYGWGAGGGYYMVNLTRHFRLGYERTWYDGPHHSFSLGFFHLCWC